MITQATFDILDAELRADESFRQTLPADLRYEVYSQEFMLDPFYWDRHFSSLSQHDLQWNEFKYSDTNNLDSIITSDETGIYLFIVKSANLIHDMPKFVIYVGISGEDDSNRSLKDRLNDYYNINEIKKRNRLHRLLRKYYSNTYIAYTFLTASGSVLKQIETDLHGFFDPICGLRDFPVDMKTIKKSF